MQLAKKKILIMISGCSSGLRSKATLWGIVSLHNFDESDPCGIFELFESQLKLLILPAEVKLFTGADRAHAEPYE
jgi:hypothetical protein